MKFSKIALQQQTNRELLAANIRGDETQSGI